MSQIINNKKVFTLLEVANSIKKTLSDRYGSSVWIKAEMNKLNHYPHTGHCYPDLVEKTGGKAVAQMRATLWKKDYLPINENFIKILREPLKDGIKILLLASITFDPMYGLSLHIQDIDPAYTLGDLEAEKLATIQQLQNEGLYFKNKNLALPLIPQRVAIISVATSKGYADFLEVIDKNPWNYKIFHFLFPAILQGENAISSIMYQLEKIRKVLPHFDVVAIIRGGGGDVGLSCYNSYELTKAITNFPLPVVTGIGHATNETVAELISHFNAITPTKLGEFLLQKFNDFAAPLSNSENKLIRLSLKRLTDARTELQFEARTFRATTSKMIALQRSELKNKVIQLEKEANHNIRSNQNQIDQNYRDIVKESEHILSKASNSLHQIKTDLENRTNYFLDLQKRNLRESENNIRIMSPEMVLKRGYSILWKNDQLIRTIHDVESGDTIQAQVSDGKIISIVQSKETKTNE